MRLSPGCLAFFSWTLVAGTLLHSQNSQADTDGGIPATGVLTRPPELVRKVEAPYPESALDAGLGGAVLLELDIGEDGRMPPRA